MRKAEGDDDLERKRGEKPRLESPKSIDKQKSSLPHGEPSQNLALSSMENICTHPIECLLFNVCMKCGEKKEDKRSDTKDNNTEKLLHHRKLCLVLDLDHTLVHSALYQELTEEEGYLMDQDTLSDALRCSLFKLEGLQLMTKLRPYVDTFLKEASKLFEMYIYTMGTRQYATEVAKLLDPHNIYFGSKILAQENCPQMEQKGLDAVSYQESAVLIVDDTESVWEKHKDNLILIERYQFFDASRKDLKSLSEQGQDESLATILRVLQRVHSLFFESDGTDNLKDRDVRQVIKSVRKEVLNGCTIAFSHDDFPDKHHWLWKMAEQLGATCWIGPLDSTSTVTHVVSVNSSTDEAIWALYKKKFLVHPFWIGNSNNLWKKAPEESFPSSAR